MKFIKKNFPELVEKYENLYDGRESPPRNYVVRLDRCAFEFCKKYRIKNYIPPPSFERYTKQKTLMPMESYDIDNLEVATLLLLMAFFKVFKSANPCSAWAYHKASQNMENLNESMKDVCERGELRKIPGVGEGIIKFIEDYLSEGRSGRLVKEMNTW